MDFIIEFLKDNWRFVAEIVLTLIVLLVSLLRKKVKITKHAFANFLAYLPELINEAEVRFGAGSGDKKFEYVIGRARELLGIYYDEDLVNYYLPEVKEAVENILSTPKKKER